jgi:K+-sensing histidine kinase KdpD
VIVEDFGVGMSEESLGKLFLDFTKLEEHSSMNTNGVGLGLSICKSLIDQMGGNVHVES